MNNGLEKLKGEALTSSAPRLPTFTGCCGLLSQQTLFVLLLNCLCSLGCGYDPAARLEMVARNVDASVDDLWV